MSQPNQAEDIRDELEQNSELLKENNRLLRKLHRFHVISAWFKVLWIVLLVGLPFAVYVYIIKPYFEALGASYDTFQMGINELPGLKEFNKFWGGGEPME